MSLEPRIRNAANDVGAQHCLDVRVRARAHLVERRARHTVARDDDGPSAVLDAVREARLHRTMVGRGDTDVGGADRERVARRDLRHVDERPPREVRVVREPVPDVVRERVERRVDDVARADRTRDAQRRGRLAHHPVRRDHVVEVGDVVAVQVRDQQAVEHHRQHAGRREPHQHGSAAVDEHGHAVRSHEGGGARALRIGDRAAGAEQRDLHGGPSSACSSSTRPAQYVQLQRAKVTA